MRIAGLALCAATLFAGPAAALGPVAFGPDLGAAGRERLDFRGRPPAAFATEGQASLRLRADAAVSVLYRPLPGSFAEAAAASWRWRVEAGVPPTDLGDRRADDRSIALYFLFADDARAQAEPPRSLRAALGRGRALVYVWGGRAARGSVIPSPQMAGRGQLVVRRPADTPTGEWLSEAVDLRADFRRVFGREPGPLMGLAISTDSDNSATRTEAVLSDLVIR